MKPALLLEEWWAAPEYSSGELILPGQSSLSAPGLKLLEDVSGIFDAGKLEIPPMPKAAMEAIRILRGSDVEIDDVVRCVMSDPGLSLQVLRHANSALYGSRHPIDNLRQAIMHVGMRRLKALVLEIAMHRTTSDIRSREWAAQEWRYSLYCANIARFIAKARGLDQELAYLAGLLHDVGRLPIMKVLDQRNALNESPHANSESEVIIECLHRGVGRDVAKAWELPPAVADAIVSHLNGRNADDESNAQFDSTRCAEAASDLCHALGLGRVQREFDVLHACSLRDVGFTEEGLAAFLRDELPQAIEQVAELA